MIGAVTVPMKRQGKSEAAEVHLQVTVPRRLKHALDVQAAESGKTKRTIVLEALRNAGFYVTDEEIAGRRGGRE